MEDDTRVPYAPDFTPSTLGKKIGKTAVLTELLAACDRSKDKSALSDWIQEQCLSHIAKPKDRADMASHVVQGLQNYGLVIIDDVPTLTNVGSILLEENGAEQADTFARHILANCNGMRFIETIQQIMLRGEKPTMESIAIIVDRHPTSKSISTMRAWLGLAGLFGGKSYRVDMDAFDRVAGNDVVPLFGLSRDQNELLIAARTLEAQTGESWVRAADAKNLALIRDSDLRIPHKALSSYLKRLAAKDVIEVGSVRGKGGSGASIRLIAAGRAFGDDALRNLLAQSSSGIALSELRPLDEVLVDLDVGHAQQRGEAGEMLAVHLALALGLKIEGWRTRAPEAEIDLMAERSIGLSYQRWAIQVKNTDGKVDSDRVDREIGAAAGSGTTHILFVAPRSTLTGPAKREALTRSRLTELHIYYLDSKALQHGVGAMAIVDELQRQHRELVRHKRKEAQRRAR